MTMAMTAKKAYARGMGLSRTAYTVLNFLISTANRQA